MTKLTPMQQYAKVQALIAADRQARTLGTGRMLSDATIKRIRAAAARYELQHGPSYVLRSFSFIQLDSAAPTKPKDTTDDKLTWAFITTLGLLAGMALYASAQIAGVL